MVSQIPSPVVVEEQLLTLLDVSQRSEDEQLLLSDINCLYPQILVLKRVVYKAWFIAKRPGIDACLVVEFEVIEHSVLGPNLSQLLNALTLDYLSGILDHELIFAYVLPCEQSQPCPFDIRLSNSREFRRTQSQLVVFTPVAATIIVAMKAQTSVRNADPSLLIARTIREAAGRRGLASATLQLYHT